MGWLSVTTTPHFNSACLSSYFKTEKNMFATIIIQTQNILIRLHHFFLHNVKARMTQQRWEHLGDRRRYRWQHLLFVIKQKVPAWQQVCDSSCHCSALSAVLAELLAEFWNTGQDKEVLRECLNQSHVALYYINPGLTLKRWLWTLVANWGGKKCCFALWCVSNFPALN